MTHFVLLVTFLLLMIGVIHYDMGNVSSVVNALCSLQTDVKIVFDPKGINGCRGIILPGVGAFSHGIENLKKLGFIETLEKHVFDLEIPFLGICLGMQLLVESGTEYGTSRGLGWIKGSCLQIEHSNEIRVPHMGWNDLEITKPSQLLSFSDHRMCFYFAHSYHVILEEKSTITSLTQYGNQIVSSLETKNIFGVQFHPEKSHSQGLQVLSRFVDLCHA